MMHLTRPTPLALPLILGALALGGCAEPGVRVSYGDVVDIPRQHGHFITPVDYFECGQERVRSFLSSKRVLDAEVRLGEVIDRCESFCVRVEVRTLQRGADYNAELGSGVLVDNGRYVLTAAHVVAGSAAPQILVTLMDGRVVPARIAASSHEGNDDWALLVLDRGDVGTLVAAELGKPVNGELVIALGYPEGNAGKTETGSIVVGAGRDGRYLAPLPVIARVTGSSPLLLRPEAGVIPVGGMSGSPLIDGQGRVVGILSAGIQSYDADGVIHTMRASPVDSAMQWLTEAAGSPTEGQ